MAGNASDRVLDFGRESLPAASGYLIATTPLHISFELFGSLVLILPQAEPLAPHGDEDIVIAYGARGVTYLKCPAGARLPDAQGAYQAAAVLSRTEQLSSIEQRIFDTATELPLNDDNALMPHGAIVDRIMACRAICCALLLCRSL